jgi:5-methylthioribose kinase
MNAEAVVNAVAGLSDTIDGNFLFEILGTETSAWKVERELSGGNINFTYLIGSTCTTRKLIVKSAPPFIKIAPTWKCDQKRLYFEYSQLEYASKVAPGLVPAVHYYSPTEHYIIMEYLDNYITMREMFITGQKCDKLASNLAKYLANTLFYSSDFHLTLQEKSDIVSKYSKNSELCAVTQQVIFHEPYMKDCKANYWTSNSIDLDTFIREDIQSDNTLKLAVLGLLEKFRTQTQAIIHADLHTGSVMVNVETGRIGVIDAEFTFCGPMGFDIGLLFANIAIAHIAQNGYENRDSYRDYVAKLIPEIWTTFVQEFLSLWKQSKGDMYPQDFVQEIEDEIQQRFFARLYNDSLGFAGLELIRRVIGMASCADTLAIPNLQTRAACEIEILKLGKQFVLDPPRIN